MCSRYDSLRFLVFLRSCIDNLIADGLRADKADLVQRLQTIGEWRFVNYAGYFRSGSSFGPDATVEAVWRLYEFDHRLRSMCLEAIGYIETQVRSHLAYCFARQCGEFGYLDTGDFPNFASGRPGFTWWRGKVEEVIKSEQREQSSLPSQRVSRTTSSRTPFPIWTIAERMDFGMTLAFFQGVSPSIQKSAANTVGQPDAVVESWLMGLRNLRNMCAHHHRIWNWRFTRNRVKVPQRRKFPEWHSPRFDNDRIGILLTICRYWLGRIYPDNDWSERVFNLFDSYANVPASEMGPPQNWRAHPLWKI